MAFLRKALTKFSTTNGHSSDHSFASDEFGVGNMGSRHGTLPASSLQHDVGMAFWNATEVPSSSSSTEPAFVSRFGSSPLAASTDMLPPPPKRESVKKAGSSSFLTNLANLSSPKLDKTTATSHRRVDSTAAAATQPNNEPTPSSPPARKRSKKKKRQHQNNSFVMLQSFLQANNTTITPPTDYLHPGDDMSKRLEEAAQQARLALQSANSTGPEAEGSVGVDEPPCYYVDERDAPTLKPVEPSPSSSFIRGDINSRHHERPLPDEPKSDDEPSWPATKEVASHSSPALDMPIDVVPAHPGLRHDLNHRLATLLNEEETCLQAIQQLQIDSSFQPEDIPNYHLEDEPNLLLHDIPSADVSSTPTPHLPSISKPPVPPKQDFHVQQLEEQLRLLHSNLAESKARINSLAEEKLQMVREHREEITSLSNRLREREEAEGTYVAQIKSLASENQSLKEEREDIEHRLRHVAEENEALEKTNSLLRIESLESREFKKEMRRKVMDYEQITKEKSAWQGQIDTMQQRLTATERSARCLDLITRQKYEAKQEGAYGSDSAVGRSTMLHYSPHVKGPSMDVVNAVATFNDEILQTASFLVENLEDARSLRPLILSRGATRANEVWGLKVVAMLERQAKKPDASNFLLLQNCLEVFITHWCARIIDGWYPQQASFSDILVEITAQKTYVNSLVPQQICGKQVQVIRTESATPEFDRWVKDIVNDLSSILLVGGVRVPASKSNLLSSRLLPLLKLAYNLRLSLAERDICGGLELAAPSPDMPFHPEFMEDAEEYAMSRKRKGDDPSSYWIDAGDYIAGTSAIGLKRTLNGQPGVYEMVVKPKVSLIRVLESAL